MLNSSPYIDSGRFQFCNSCPINMDPLIYLMVPAASGEEVCSFCFNFGVEHNCQSFYSFYLFSFYQFLPFNSVALFCFNHDIYYEAGFWMSLFD